MTPDGVFVIRRLTGLDFVLSKSPLITLRDAAAAVESKGKEQALEALAAETDAERLARIVIERGTVSDEVYRLKESDAIVNAADHSQVSPAKYSWYLDKPKGGEMFTTSRVLMSEELPDDEELVISAFDLDDDSLVILSQEIKAFSKLTKTAALDTQLDNFRTRSADGA